MNKVILMGRLTRDLNVRYTQQNGSQESMCVARYTLAVDRRGARDGQQSADFISCVAFGKNGEFAEKYLKQGTKIVVTGRIQTGSYTNRDGQKVYTTDVVIAFYVSEKEGCDNMGILKGIIDRFRAMGKSEKEISGIIETAADKATANPDVTKPEKPKKPEIKIETTAEAFVEAVLRTGTTLQQAKTAILKMSSLRDAENRKNTNNWRKMHGLPMRRKQKARKKHERGKGADGH